MTEVSQTTRGHCVSGGPPGLHSTPDKARIAHLEAENAKLRDAIMGMLTWAETRPSPHPYDTWKAARRAVGLEA